MLEEPDVRSLNERYGSLNVTTPGNMPSVHIYDHEISVSVS